MHTYIARVIDFIRQIHDELTLPCEYFPIPYQKGCRNLTDHMDLSLRVVALQLLVEYLLKALLRISVPNGLLLLCLGGRMQ